MVLEPDEPTIRHPAVLADALGIQVRDPEEDDTLADTDEYRSVDCGGGYDATRPLEPVLFPVQEAVPGALAARYDVPEVTFRHRWAVTLTITVALIVAGALWRLRGGVVHLDLFLASIALVLGFRAFGWVLSCLDKPARVKNAAQQAYLDGLFVTVSIPCFNEDPGLLDRALWALANQSRRPDHIDVVDDGSTKIDYVVLAEYWSQFPWFTWTRKENEGKRRAHCTTFAQDTRADVFVTVDSDTTLVRNAIEEGMKPFIDPEIQSVAGVELGYNASKNFLTVVQNALQQIAQAVVAAAWSVSGDMFTNRGPFALYRAPMIRKILPLYGNETFYGHRIKLGDDSLLALAGSMSGKSVQQLSAFGLTMWPENLSHHLRQRVRWARGRTIRNFWRLKYYRVGSYIWLYTIINTYAFFVAIASLIRLSFYWHEAAPLLARIVLAILLLGWLSQLRVLCFKRSDETWLDRALLIAVRPVASVWATFVLTRIVRLAGTLTCLKQGWTTRQAGAELTLDVEGEMA